MKKVLFVACMILALLNNLQAQEKMKIAVLDFKPGVGVTEAEVNGLSEMLITALFETNKFTIVERTQLDKAITEQGFQKSSISAGEIAKVGKILGVKSVLVGTVNFIATNRTSEQVTTGMITGEYNIDVRIVNVESGEIMSSAGVTKTASKTYRDLMPSLTGELTKKIISSDGGQVFKLFGYLYVFPENLGNYTYKEAMEMCDNINSANLYGFNNWRLPTLKELKIIYQNKDKLDGFPIGTYLSSEPSGSTNYNNEILYEALNMDDGTNAHTRRNVPIADPGVTQGIVRLVRTTK